jgi:hypothetical protein
MQSLLALLFSFFFFTDTPVRIDTPVTAEAPLITESPRVQHFQAPSYPEVAWQSKVHGKVTLKILVHKDGRFAFAEEPAGPPALVSAAKENLCSWTFASNSSDQPLPLTVVYDYFIDKGRSSAQLNAEVSYDLPNHVTVTAPQYSPSCLCVKKRSKWKPWD